MPKKPPRKLRVIKAHFVSAENVRKIAAKLEKLRRIERIVYEEECLFSVLTPDAAGDCLRRVHANGYRRILAVLNKP
jgi:dsRNA-specific ribonuclease